MFKDASPIPSGDRENESSSSDDDAEDETPVESLVVGREKRATAGNRLAPLLGKEGGDDDLELLFAEDEEEEDVEFEEEDEDASDAELDSSTDEEDQGPTKGDDDMTGEKELQKQERTEKQRKRKAQEVFKRSGAQRKKVKVDPSATPTTSTSRPKKKSERVSWVPTEADAPVRASSRKQTVQNREVVHQRLVEGEQTRLKIMSHMEEAAKRKAALKPKALTQADRMEEAAKTERKNAKSLNRWEETERKRSEEQKAKLEALHNRKLSGPVIASWSGLARCVNGKIGEVGVKEIRRSGFTEKPTLPEDQIKVSGPKSPPSYHLYGSLDQDVAMSGVIHPHSLTESSQQLLQNVQPNSYQQQITFTAPQGPYGFLDGIHAYANLPMQQQQAEFTGTAHGDSFPQSYPGPYVPNQAGHRPVVPQPIKALAPVIEFASLNLVALKSIDANASRLPELQDSVLLKKPKIKLQKTTPEGCAITMQPARFRDPKTGLAYANSYAYKEIQRLGNGGARWTSAAVLLSPAYPSSMSSFYHAKYHTPHSPPHMRKSANKAARATPHSKSASTPKITIKGAKASKSAKEEEEEAFDLEDDDDMGSTFLQYCAMCDKQILVPNSSILYCSESCRQRDSSPPTPNSYLSLASPTRMVPSTFIPDIDDPFGSRIPTYIPRMQPSPHSLNDARIPPMAHEGKSDLDPTEWKPAEPATMEGKSPTKEWKPKLLHRPSSEAFSYLSKFHRSSDSLASKRRPVLNHSRTTSRATPSLTHTPTTSTSSQESLLAGTPYELVGASLPGISTAQASGDAGLVNEAGDLTYEKKFVPASLDSAAGSLKKLLGTTAGAM
ncbi:vacuolar protein sorting-associated protein 72, partial [Lecanoromycetidae sp. Uapishka_2]